MSMRKTLLAALGAAALAAACTGPTTVPEAAAPQRLGIGRIASAQEVRGWDIDVTPDGRGLPAGSGTPAQGRQLFAQRCAACHGAQAHGGIAPALVGGANSLATRKPLQTIGSFWPYATTLYDYIARAMPQDRPMSLAPDEVYALTAFLLSANGIIDERSVMDARTLAQVRMPNRSGFLLTGDTPAVPAQRCMRDCRPAQ